MKNLFFGLLLAALLPLAASAQEYPSDRGSWIVAGSASLISQGSDFDEDGRTTSASLRPSVKYFVLPGLALGAEVILSHLRDERFKATAVGAGPALAYYFGGADRRLLPFVATRGTLTSSHSRFEPLQGPFGDTAPVVTRTSTSLSFDASAGGVLMIARNVGLTGEVFYTLFDSDVDEEDDRSNIFGLRFGVAAFVF